MTEPRPTILLTRPAPQSERFAEECRAVFGGIRVEISPVLRIRFRDAGPDLGAADAVVLTSENGARALAAARPVVGLPAWCVGDRTAQAAEALGMPARSARGDADDLVSAILAARPSGRLVHVRGAESRGRVAQRLRDGGLDAHEAVLYDQESQPLGAAARALLQGDKPVILPVFSPRSAGLLSRQAAAATAPLDLVALSPAVAEAWTGPAPRRLHVCARPDTGAMLAGIAEVLGRDPP